jgi:hypothetical protein
MCRYGRRPGSVNAFGNSSGPFSGPMLAQTEQVVQDEDFEAALASGSREFSSRPELIDRRRGKTCLGIDRENEWFALRPVNQMASNHC